MLAAFLWRTCLPILYELCNGSNSDFISYSNTHCKDDYFAGFRLAIAELSLFPVKFLSTCFTYTSNSYQTWEIYSTYAWILFRLPFRNRCFYVLLHVSVITGSWMYKKVVLLYTHPTFSKWCYKLFKLNS